MKCLLPVLLGLTILAVSCRSSSTPPASAPPPPSVPLLAEKWSGAYSEATTAGTRTVATAEEWRELWRQVQREAPRALDPQRERAVAVFLGERRTGGYSVEIEAVRIEAGQLVVEYRESGPPPDAMVTQALTAPWAIAVASRTDLPVTFRRQGPPVPRGRL